MNDEKPGSQKSAASQYQFDFPEDNLDRASKDFKEQFANPKGEQKQETEKEKEERGEPKLEYNPPEDPKLQELMQISNKIKADKEAQKQLELKYGKGFGNDGLEM